MPKAESGRFIIRLLNPASKCCYEYKTIKRKGIRIKKSWFLLIIRGSRRRRNFLLKVAKRIENQKFFSTEYISTVLGNYCYTPIEKGKPKKHQQKGWNEILKKCIQNFTQDCNPVAFPLRDYSTALLEFHRLVLRHLPMSAPFLRHKIILFF